MRKLNCTHLELRNGFLIHLGFYLHDAWGYSSFSWLWYKLLSHSLIPGIISSEDCQDAPLWSWPPVRSLYHLVIRPWDPCHGVYFSGHQIDQMSMHNLMTCHFWKNFLTIQKFGVFENDDVPSPSPFNINIINNIAPGKSGCDRRKVQAKSERRPGQKMSTQM